MVALSGICVLLCSLLFSGFGAALPMQPATTDAEIAPDAPAREEAPPSEEEPSKDEAWCAPELEAKAPGECVFLRSKPSKTLVIFLHGVVQSESGWQYNQQKAMVRAAKANEFDLYAPRGFRGIGPKGMEDYWAWPTKASSQKEKEAALFTGWLQLREQLEAERGEAYQRLLIIGFSNGAYYSSSLVLRDAFQADGYAVLAGGGASYLEQRARNTKRRAPVYVGYGLKDKTARDDAAGFGKLLARLGWKHQVRPRPGVGHSMTDSQLAEAIKFLSGN